MLLAPAYTKMGECFRRNFGISDLMFTAMLINSLIEHTRTFLAMTQFSMVKMLINVSTAGGDVPLTLFLSPPPTSANSSPTRPPE